MDLETPPCAGGRLYYLPYWYVIILYLFPVVNRLSENTFFRNRAGANEQPLSHHRTCRSAYGGSTQVIIQTDEIYSNEITSKTAYTGVTNIIREAYKDGKIDKEEDLDYMLMTNDYFDRGFDRAHIKNQVDGWKQE